MPTLYQTYRPQTFADIIGQESIKTTLQNELKQGSTVHAYLFSGPRAVGKTTTARVFARALNCTNRAADSVEPCNTCISCLAIQEGKTLDCIEVDAASHTGIDNVRENIISAARVANSLLKYKVFIIDEVHMLSTAAFNALLKLMEEPPENVVFILATTELHKVPATIISRCQRFDFKHIHPDVMKERLADITAKEGRVVTDGVLEQIVRLSGGCERDAESLLGQVLCLEGTIDETAAAIMLPRSDVLLVEAVLKGIATKKADESLRALHGMVSAGGDVVMFGSDCVDALRDILLIKKEASDLLSISEATKKTRTALAADFDEQHLLHTITQFIGATRDAKWFSVPFFPLEVAIIKSCLYTHIR